MSNNGSNHIEQPTVESNHNSNLKVAIGSKIIIKQTPSVSVTVYRVDNPGKEVIIPDAVVKGIQTIGTEEMVILSRNEIDPETQRSEIVDYAISLYFFQQFYGQFINIDSNSESRVEASLPVLPTGIGSIVNNSSSSTAELLPDQNLELEVGRLIEILNVEIYKYTSYSEHSTLVFQASGEITGITNEAITFTDLKDNKYVVRRSDLNSINCHIGPQTQPIVEKKQEKVIALKEGDTIEVSDVQFHKRTLINDLQYGPSIFQTGNVSGKVVAVDSVVVTLKDGSGNKYVVQRSLIKNNNCIITTAPVNNELISSLQLSEVKQEEENPDVVEISTADNIKNLIREYRTNEEFKKGLLQLIQDIKNSLPEELLYYNDKNVLNELYEGVLHGVNKTELWRYHFHFGIFNKRLNKFIMQNKESIGIALLDYANYLHLISGRFVDILKKNIVKIDEVKEG